MIEVNIFYIVIIAVVCSMVNIMMTVMLQVRAVQDVDVGEELQVLCLKDTSWWYYDQDDQFHFGLQWTWLWNNGRRIMPILISGLLHWPSEHGRGQGEAFESKVKPHWWWWWEGRKICCRYNFQCDCKVCSLPPEQLQNNDKVKREASCASYLAGAELKGSEGNPWFGKQPWGRVQGSACQGSEVRNSCEMELRNC